MPMTELVRMRMIMRIPILTILQRTVFVRRLVLLLMMRRKDLCLLTISTATCR